MSKNCLFPTDVKPGKKEQGARRLPTRSDDKSRL